MLIENLRLYASLTWNWAERDPRVCQLAPFERARTHKHNWLVISTTDEHN